eukprot:SAG31_NODE_7624_length_1636_cov_2.502277_1_plen_54_part_00
MTVCVDVQDTGTKSVDLPDDLLVSVGITQTVVFSTYATRGRTSMYSCTVCSHV